MKDTFYFPSTSPGKTWAITVGKVPGHAASVSATEGDYVPAKEPGGFSSFSFVMFGARSRRRVIEGPATAKKKAAALDALVAEMKADGLIAEAA